MGWDVFSDDCPGCRPSLLNCKTGKAMADDTPEMQRLNKMWETTTRDERLVFHRVTCQNSRAVTDMMVFEGIVKRVQSAMLADD